MGGHCTVSCFQSGVACLIKRIVCLLHMQTFINYFLFQSVLALSGCVINLSYMVKKLSLLNSHSLEDAKAGYTLQKYSYKKYTLENYLFLKYTIMLPICSFSTVLQNCPLFIVLPNCPLFHCSSKLSSFHCSVKLSQVPNCPLFNTVPNCPLFNMVPNCPLFIVVSNCPR